MLAAARKSSRYSLLYKEGSDSFRVTTWNRQRQKSRKMGRKQIPNKGMPGMAETVKAKYNGNA